MRLLTTIILFTSLLFSCSEPCDDVDCGPNGTCNTDTGACICDDWYDGTNCENEVRSKFLGTWNSTTPCTFNGEPTTPTWNIEAAANIDEIIFQASDFYNNTLIEATLTSENEAVITPVILGNLNISGTLSYVNETRLTLDAVIDGTNVITCTYDLRK